MRGRLCWPLGVLVVATPAIAQMAIPESPVSVTGALVSADEAAVIIRTGDGPVTVAMTPHWTAGKARTASLRDIKSGEFIATTNIDIAPQTGRSVEVRIFEPGYEPEHGTHAMPRPNTSMTHGRVSTTTLGPDGVRLVVTYPGGSRSIEVPAGTKVTAYDLVDRKLAIPGVTVSAVTRKGPDGVPRAGRLLLATP